MFQIWPCQFHVFYLLIVQPFKSSLKHIHLCVRVCSRGSRWWWQSSWRRHTPTSTSPSCILAGLTLQVLSANTHAQCWESTATKDLDKFNTIAIYCTKNQSSLLPNSYSSLFPSISVCVPAVANAMPEFHSSMKDSLRTPEQGADTVVWLAVTEAATKNPSGHFYQGMLH